MGQPWQTIRKENQAGGEPMTIILVKVVGIPGLGKLISESVHYSIIEYKNLNGWSYRIIALSEDCDHAGVIEIEEIAD